MEALLNNGYLFKQKWRIIAFYNQLRSTYTINYGIFFCQKNAKSSVRIWLGTPVTQLMGLARGRKLAHSAPQSPSCAKVMSAWQMGQPKVISLAGLLPVILADVINLSESSF